MKQTYIAPNTKCVEIEISQMVAESMKVDKDTTKGFGSSLGKEENFSDQTSSSVWGSDEEE